jgi:hypothetical protein
VYSGPCRLAASASRLRTTDRRPWIAMLTLQVLTSGADSFVRVIYPLHLGCRHASPVIPSLRGISRFGARLRGIPPSSGSPVKLARLQSVQPLMLRRDCPPLNGADRSMISLPRAGRGDQVLTWDVVQLRGPTARSGHVRLRALCHPRDIPCPPRSAICESRCSLPPRLRHAVLRQHLVVRVEAGARLVGWADRPIVVQPERVVVHRAPHRIGALAVELQQQAVRDR